MRLRDLMVARDIPSRIYVEMTDPDTAAESQPVAAYAQECVAGDVLLYQFATASDMAPWLLSRPETLVVNYHNVTPPEFYAPWDNGLARHQLRARAELASLAPRAVMAIAMSVFNEAELQEAGYGSTAVVPPAAMLPTGSTAQSVPVEERQGARWISVGRLAPNKALQHAVMALLVARMHLDPAATLEIVGRSVVPSYTNALHRFVDEMGLHDAVTFRGQLADDDLVHAMSGADVMVVTSAHEGFGVPLVEAMAMGLPVVANAAGALPEVLGSGGVLVDTSDPWALAEATAGVLADPARRDGLASGARAQLNALDLATAGDRAIDLVSQVR
jgi:glycosyltransferase involved in cell wall biosynthesis